jgi:hypothetical protein
LFGGRAFWLVGGYAGGSFGPGSWVCPVELIDAAKDSVNIGSSVLPPGCVGYVFRYLSASFLLFGCLSVASVPHGGFSPLPLSLDPSSVEADIFLPTECSVLGESLKGVFRKRES